MILKLNPFERVVLNSLLSQKSDNAMHLRMVMTFRRQLCFNGDEIKKWGVKDNLLSWDSCTQCKIDCGGEDPDVELCCAHRLREYNIPKPLEKLIYDMLKSMDDGKKVTLRELSLVEKFCYSEEEKVVN